MKNIIVYHIDSTGGKLIIMFMKDFIYHLTNNQVNDDFVQKANDERERFMDGKPVNTKFVPDEIYASWIRSKSYGLDPKGNGPYLLDDSRKKELAAFRQMERKYSNYFDRVDEILNNEFPLIVFDKDLKSGRNLWLVGDYPEHTIGFDCSEQKIGTTAAFLASHKNQPMIVLGIQHYQSDLHATNYAAAPIHNKKKEVIGVFDLAFYDLKQASKAYYLVKYLAKSFDVFYSLITDEYETMLNQIMDLLPQGIALLNEKNSIHFYNKKILDILKINSEHDVQQQLKKHFSKIGIGEKLNERKIIYNHDQKLIDISIFPQNADKNLFNHSNNLIVFEEFLQIDEVKSNADHQYKLYNFEDIIGNSQALLEAKEVAIKVAKTSVPVLIWGENGTGKEMFAQSIHNISNRRGQPFVAINCGSIPADIAESELFGYEEGSFTGAMKGGKIGKIEASSGGSLFLDEIESMPLYIQIKLLRVFAAGSILKVGGTKEIPVDLRIIAATKRDLLQEADRGSFREDLYYRLSTFVIKLPALRERKEDILLLTQYFIKNFSDQYSINDIEIESAAFEALSSYSWRGNIRELEHVIERALILLGNERVVTLQHLPEKIQIDYHHNNARELIQTAIDQTQAKKGLLAIAEEIIIEHTLKMNDGNISEAARQLGIDRKTMYNKLQKSPNLVKSIKIKNNIPRS